MGDQQHMAERKAPLRTAQERLKQQVTWGHTAGKQAIKLTEKID